MIYFVVRFEGGEPFGILARLINHRPRLAGLPVSFSGPGRFPFLVHTKDAKVTRNLYVQTLQICRRAHMLHGRIRRRYVAIEI